jgi:hypothetical protein
MVAETKIIKTALNPLKEKRVPNGHPSDWLI